MLNKLSKIFNIILKIFIRLNLSYVFKNKKTSSFKNVDIWVLVTIFLFNIIFLNLNIVSDDDIFKDGISDKIDQIAS